MKLNERPSIVQLKEQLLKKIPYVPASADARRYLFNHDIGDLLHIYHFWRQRFPQPVARRYHAPSGVRNDAEYVRHKERINRLKRKIEAGEDLSAYLSRKAFTAALDVDGYRESKSFMSSRDQLLVCHGFYHFHLAPFPERTREVLVAQVLADVFEVVGLFTHDLFEDDESNAEYVKYSQAVDAFVARKFPSGGMFLGGPGGSMQNAAGSSITSTWWQIYCRKVLQQVEADTDGINGFTIKLYQGIFDRQTGYVNSRWEVADDGRLLIRDRKNKHEFWMDGSGKWHGQPWA